MLKSKYQSDKTPNCSGENPFLPKDMSTVKHLLLLLLLRNIHFVRNYVKAYIEFPLGDDSSSLSSSSSCDSYQNNLFL